MAEELGDQLAVPSWEAKMAEERVVLLAPQELVVVLAKEWEVLMVGWLAGESANLWARALLLLAGWSVELQSKNPSDQDLARLHLWTQ
jgi:hypothetical protein